MRLSIFLFAVLAGAGPLGAQTLAFTANGTGQQQLTDVTLGLLFQLNAPLTVRSIGYWDHSFDGTPTTLTVAIYDRGPATPVIVSGTQIDFNGTTGVLLPGGTLGGQFRLINLTLPVVLPAGAYTLAAWGFSDANRFINNTVGNGVDVDTFGGVLNFVSSQFANSPGVYPNQTDTNFAQYAAATFSNSTVSAIPEPARTATIIAAAGLLGCWIVRRRSGRKDKAIVS